MTKAPALVVIMLLVLAATQAGTSSRSPLSITSPTQQFGTAIGADYFLASYAQLETYWKTLDRESDRVTLADIGRTEEGRTQWMAVVSAPDNIARLGRYRDISRRLARGEGLTDTEARGLAQEGKAIVWIDGGLHANEVLGAQQLIEIAYQLASRSDAETLRILHDVIVLIVDANPDGHELVTNWYMREKNPLLRSIDNLPAPYQKYVGHDNNRDFYMGTQAETRNINRVLYRDWFPQIVYDHHQADLPDGVMFAPPFRGPSNYLFDPLIAKGIDRIGRAIRTRLASNGMGGLTAGSGPGYSTWWNGGLRTTPYFHNQIGILTETIGSPTPFERASVLGGTTTWHFRQSIEYSMAANYAVLDLASRDRQRWLYDSYLMARNSIERGSRDSWTSTPHHPRTRASGPGLRDARGYVLPADQPDFLTATKFVNALLQAGVSVERATGPFSIGARKYPAESFVIEAAQAFRPHVLDMFEPQDHPDDIPPGGDERREPYDLAGWTLAFQMGVRFDRVLDPFSGPFEPITTPDVMPPAGRFIGPDHPTGYVLSRRTNDAAVVVNRVLKAREPVYAGPDSYYFDATASTAAILREAATVGLTFTGTARPPGAEAVRLREARVGLIDRRDGWSSSGWIRWLLERYEFPFQVVYVDEDSGPLRSRFDVVILPAEASGEDVSALKSFVESGGTLVALGGATTIAHSVGVPVSAVGAGYFIPGSILRAAVDNRSLLAYGFDQTVDLSFENSPVFRLDAGASSRTVTPVVWFSDAEPLRSGWAVGQEHLKGAAAAVDARVGRGHVVLFGPDVTFRGQSQGTFKFLFNAIYRR